MDRPVCLVLMPMYAGFEDVRACVARAIDRAGLSMRRLEAEIADSAWHLWLLESTDTSDLVLVDLTGHNPFVMYELGYVHYRQLPASFVVDVRDQRLPATVRGAVCTPYGDGCPHFERDLAEHLRELWATRDGGGTSEASLEAATAPADLYRAALAAADAFERAWCELPARVDEIEFAHRLAVAQRRGDARRPHTLSSKAGARYLLTLLLEHSDRVELMRAICDWSFDRDPRALMTTNSAPSFG